MASGGPPGTKSWFRVLTSHKNKQKSSVEMVASGGTTVASGGKWWQVVAGGGRWWQMVASAGRVGGMGGAARLRQKLSEFDRF